MLERLMENKAKIKELLEKDDNFIESLTSEELFQIIVTFSKDDMIRPFIVKNADKILVMKDGAIIESGTHGELLEKGGFYSELYNSQFAVY